MLTTDNINELLGITESFHASYKLIDILKNKEEREKLFLKFLELENDFSFDWFTEYFQEEHSDRKGKKQDFTPDGIIKVASGVLGNTNSNADICAGTGGLTIKRWSENPTASFYCEEFSDRAIPFLVFNLAIRNMDAIICHGDSLTREFKTIYKLTKGERFSAIESLETVPEIKAQTVIMNPPYSLPWDPKKEYLEQERFKDYSVLSPKSKSDFAFLLTGLNLLEESGVMSIILPHGVLFRGAAEGEIRKRLIELNYLDTVIGMPEKAFLATDIPTVILVLKKHRETKDILFIDASKECTKQAKQNVVEQKHVDKILATISKRETIEKFSKVVPWEELKENEFNLNIPRYVDTFEAEEVASLTEIVSDLKEVDGKIDHCYQELTAMMQELVASDPQTQKELDEMTSYFVQRTKKRKMVRGEQMTLL